MIQFIYIFHNFKQTHFAKGGSTMYIDSAYWHNKVLDFKDKCHEGADIFLDYLSDQSKSMSVLYRTQIS